MFQLRFMGKDRSADGRRMKLLKSQKTDFQGVKSVEILFTYEMNLKIFRKCNIHLFSLSRLQQSYLENQDIVLLMLKSHSDHLLVYF